MIKIGICGYGNLGKGVEKALLMANDMELVGIFTRRDPKSLNHPLAYQMEDLKEFENKIDVLILCGGSATDLPIQTPMLATRFNVVDSFDTHAKIKQHFDNVDQNARLASKTAIISTGWDPGLFSLNRIYMEAVLPNGKEYTFWGKGVSQGHSDAIRRIKGVKNAKQYTIPKEDALELVRKGVQPNLSVRDKHLRECFVVLDNDANPEVIEKQIKEMPNYFSDYDTIVHFISEEELLKNHSGIPHGGFVIRTGNTSDGVSHQIEYRLQLDSNPEFTGSVLVSYARACYRLNQEGVIGCQTVFDVAPKYLISESYENLLKHTL